MKQTVAIVKVAEYNASIKTHPLLTAMLVSFKEDILATSFINEHSVEYYLIPHLKNDLEKFFGCVAPVFPWLNRETSKISKMLHGSDNFNLLIVFPRRPKLEVNDVQNIYITINSDALVKSQAAF